MILLDTCVISEVARRDPAPAVQAWFDEQREEHLRLSALSIGELQKGVALLQAGARRDGLQGWLDGLVELFQDRIVGVNVATGRRWGTVSAMTQLAGRTRPPVDALLAATALHHDLTLATRNVRDFHGTGVRLVNPWDHKGG